jgi:hypothetical protein
MLNFKVGSRLSSLPSVLPTVSPFRPLLPPQILAIYNITSELTLFAKREIKVCELKGLQLLWGEKEMRSLPLPFSQA